MNRISLNDAFKNVRVSFTMKSIRSVFLQSNINYKPEYQREYVWPPFKATYFLETILLHSEFSPIVMFQRKDASFEVIDGRQRCETIDRFLKDQITLKASGLEKLWYLADKKFSQLGLLQERLESALIRIITIEFKNEENVDANTEELVKREFFRRYNLGISPLKKEEVYKAQYLQDEINNLFKRRFVQDMEFYNRVRDIFDHRSKNIEIQMQSIRQLLVLHNVPINRYISERDDIINMYYDYLSYENLGSEKARSILNEFQRKLTYLCQLKPLLNKVAGRSNGLVYETLYWALSVAETEKVKPEKIDNPTFKDRLVRFLTKHIKDFTLPRNNQAIQVKTRYNLVAEFFSSQLHIPFDRYMKNPDFVTVHKQRMLKYMQERIMPGLEQDYFSKTTPTTYTITDILDRMHKHKFFVRPSYQRNEIKNEAKASSLIESILKNIRLHPIYVYIRKDGVHEVIDGQQRLLSIIGFMGKSYLDEDGEMSKSLKDQFRLRIKSGLMQELNGLRFTDLSPEMQRTIHNFDIDIIEIREANNPHFKPEELFKRLNYKPFPIKEHSFEFWNAYVSTEITRPVKNIFLKDPWIYLRKNNCRMMNEELIMYLVFFSYITGKAAASMPSIKEVIKFNLINGKISLQTKSKSQITQLLENEKRRQDFVTAIRDFDSDVLAKLKVLTYHPDSSNNDLARGRQLDNLLHIKGSSRTLMSFYVLWIIIRGINIQSMPNSRPAVKNKINKIFDIFDNSDSLSTFETAIQNAWAELKNSAYALPTMA